MICLYLIFGFGGIKNKKQQTGEDRMKEQETRQGMRGEILVTTKDGEEVSFAELPLEEQRYLARSWGREVIHSELVEGIKKLWRVMRRTNKKVEKNQSST